jgi:DNA-binding NarL/FixJ family response regulator
MAHTDVGNNAGQKASPGSFAAKILVVDDHAAVRRGLKQLIGQQPDLAVSAEAEGAYQALAALEKQRFDLAIVDISMVGMNGIELTEMIKACYPELPVLILTVHDRVYYAREALKAGAGGFVTKQEAADTIITAVRDVIAGKRYVSERIAQRL